MSSFIFNLFPMYFIKFNPILLYHSLGKNSNFEKNIDHVDLEVLDSTLKTMKKYFKFVFIDEYITIRDKSKLAVITIDDGYKNVIDEALQVFEYHNIPITIFINSSTFEGKILWRDNIRHIIDNHLEKEFISYSELGNIKNFYRDTKSPNINSAIVDKKLDLFFEQNNIKIEQNLCFDSKKYLIKHPLIMYGNHTHSHYVLSSLSKNEQYNEISKTKLFLQKQDINLSNVFSIPFGGIDTYNQDTVEIVKDLGYNSMLLSRSRLNNPTKDTFFIERIMLKNNDLSFIKKAYFLSLIKDD